MQNRQCPHCDNFAPHTVFSTETISHQTNRNANSRPLKCRLKCKHRATAYSRGYTGLTPPLPYPGGASPKPGLKRRATPTAKIGGSNRTLKTTIL